MNSTGRLLSPLTVSLCLWVAFILIGPGYLKTKAQPQEAPKARSGCLSVGEKQGLRHATSTVAMPINWYIGATDVNWGMETDHPNLTGRYIGCKIAIGEPVAAEDTMGGPVISPADGKVTYLFNPNTASNSTPSSDMNAGMRVQIFGHEGVPVIADAPILALVCSDSCSPILEVAPIDIVRLGQETSGKLILVLRK